MSHKMAVFKSQGRTLDQVKEAEGVQDDIELGGPFKRAGNLVWIKENSLYREALDDWEQQRKSLIKKLDRREKRAEELTNQVYNVVGFFSVFQGVILTAVTQLTSTSSTQSPTGCPARLPICGKVWFPVVLSALAAIAAVVGIALKFRQLFEIDNLIETYRQDLREAEKRQSKLQAEGKGFLFKTLEERNRRPQKTYWVLKAVFVIGAVIVFSIVFILSYFVIFCDKFVIKGWSS